MAIELVDLPSKNGDFKQPIIYWLVVWNINFIFHNILGIILPIDELIFFKMVKTTNQWIIAEFMGLVADFGNITTLMINGIYSWLRAKLVNMTRWILWLRVDISSSWVYKLTYT